jgi:hypothetical protein
MQQEWNFEIGATDQIKLTKKAAVSWANIEGGDQVVRHPSVSLHCWILTP